MAGGKTSIILQQNDNDSLSSSHHPVVSSSRPVAPQRGSLRPVGAATVQVIQELDQLLTMDTLIYFVQAVIELLFLSFLVSFRFAYQQPTTTQPTFEQSQQQHPVRRTTLQRSTRISSVKLPVWDKRRQLAVARLSQSSESLSILVSPSSQKNNGVTSSSSSVVEVAQTSDTGSLSLTPRHVQSGINSGQLPPPPSVPLIPQPSLVPHSHSLPPSPVATTESKSSSPTSLEPTTRSPSAAKSPRRKPVQSKHSRKSSAKFDRPPLPPPETALPLPPSIDGQAQTQSPPVLDKKILETTQFQNSPKKSERLPSLKKKSSAKSLRPPVPAVQLAPKTPPIPSAPIIQPYSPPPNPVDQTPNSSPHPLVRKSSAKFIRHPPNNPSESSPIEPPTTAESQSLEQQHIPTEHPSIDSPPTFEQPPTIEEPPTIDPQTVEEPPPVEEQTQPETDAPLALLEPVPQRPISQPKLTLFPPRPAIALPQPVSDPVKPPPREQSPGAPSFPELPPLVLTNPRQPPPPPSIPRFPSPPKSVISSPSPPPRVYSNPGRQISPSPSSTSRRHVSMAAVSSYPEDVETSSENWALPEDTPERYSRTDFPREWDPSQDENIFEPNSTSVAKAVVSTTTPDERFSFHGSIASSSSNSSAPRNRSRGRLSTKSSSPNLLDRPKHTRAVSTNSQYIPSPMPSPRARPQSAGSLSSGSEYVPPQFLFNDNTHLKPGNAAALLTHAETLNLYRQNAKKAVDNPATQYEFAIFMMDAAREATLDLNGVSPSQRDEFLKEGLSILRRLADRGYPQAQYYLADCYSNGIGCKHGTPDLDKAFPLFVLAAKHGHVEASFRTALAYENAWGCRKDPLKALQFLRKAASANHPGAMLRLGMACLNSEFGMPTTQLVTVEGVNWLKRAVEAATPLYPNAPYELALLHEFGHNDVVFPDEAYAVQLFARASDLGHADAAYRLGDAYEYGRMGCPEDPALSIHYYSLAARGGNSSAMLSLCAWYMVGAEGFLEKSDAEAFAWAQKAAELGHAKAEFATGYFMERGVGCRRDALEAWKYYVRAADHGDERAIARLRAGKDLNSDRSMLASAVSSELERGRLSTSDRESDGSSNRRPSPHKGRIDLEEAAKAKDKDCIVM